MNYRYGWWPYVQSMVRNYPARMECADLGKIEQREAQAVSEAIRQTAQREDGEERLRLIRKLYWSRRRQTISGAALDLYISRATANRWHSDFIYLVAEAFGLYLRK